MDWYAVKFPQDISPFSESSSFEKDVREIYEQERLPEDFAVFMEFMAPNDKYGQTYYFNPVAYSFCTDAGLFKEYRGLPCDDPSASGRTLAQIVP